LADQKEASLSGLIYLKKRLEDDTFAVRGL
jgi:hypothetical protein